jgi:hypothetical protein
MVHVWYRDDGEIIGVGSLVQSSGRELYAIPLAREGQNVVEADVDEAAVERLHETHRVNPGEKRLTER